MSYGFKVTTYRVSAGFLYSQPWAHKPPQTSVLVKILYLEELAPFKGRYGPFKAALGFLLG